MPLRSSHIWPEPHQGLKEMLLFISGSNFRKSEMRTFDPGTSQGCSLHGRYLGDIHGAAQWLLISEVFCGNWLLFLMPPSIQWCLWQSYLGISLLWESLTIFISSVGTCRLDHDPVLCSKLAWSQRWKSALMDQHGSFLESSLLCLGPKLKVMALYIPELYIQPYPPDSADWNN